jgi:Xaa-Pro dipeptidase
MMRTSEELIRDMQLALSQAGVPAWLFYGFHAIDPIGVSILGFGPEYHATRRWFYLVPAVGEPIRLVHRIEPAMLDHLPGRKLVYLRWQELRSQLQEMFTGARTVAMQYSPENTVPYVSHVDAGTVELVRSFGVEVISSADLVQTFEARWTPEQAAQHRQTALHLTEIASQAFERAAALIKSRGATTELEIQGFISERFDQLGLIADSPAIVGVNRNSGNPHYAPTEAAHLPIRKGDFLLLDLWAKTRGADAVYADITWVGFLGRTPPDAIVKAFEVVSQARDRGILFLKETAASGRTIQGFEVDQVVRGVITQAGFGEYFVHRTGHNLGREVHGAGVNFDDLETHDTRAFVPGIACTIEPGVYFEEFGVRSEINIHFGPSGPEVTTPPQQSILLLDV